MATHVYNPSIREIEARVSGVQSQPQLYRKFKVGLGYKRLCFKNRTGGPGNIAQKLRVHTALTEDLMTSVSSTAIGYLTSLGESDAFYSP